MLTTLMLKNFQAHKKLAIDFDPHVTTIVGPSDVGKSSIIRALTWASTNKPGGDAFIRHGAKGAVVTLSVDGHTITRAKCNEGNIYFLDDQEYKAFGADVPTPIAQLLNLGDINFQGQHDSPFWFSETSGEVSRRLNAIINLQIIDNVLGYLGGRVRDAGNAITACTQRLAAAQARRDALKPIVEIDGAFKSVEHLADTAVKERARCDMARRLVEDARNYHQGAIDAGNRQRNANLALSKGDKWAELAGRRDSLAKLIENAGKLRKQARRKVPDIEGLVKAFYAADEIKNQRDALVAIVEQIKKFRDAGKVFGGIVQAAADNLKKSLGKVCPLCQQPIK
jgi:DNA repair protein SbcC/Rad50